MCHVSVERRLIRMIGFGQEPRRRGGSLPLHGFAMGVLVRSTKVGSTGS